MMKIYGDKNSPLLVNGDYAINGNFHVKFDGDDAVLNDGTRIPFLCVVPENISSMGDSDSIISFALKHHEQTKGSKAKVFTFEVELVPLKKGAEPPTAEELRKYIGAKIISDILGNYSIYKIRAKE